MLLRCMRRKWLFIGMAMLFVSTSLWASPSHKEKSESTLFTSDENTQAMLHSLALYIIAAEMFGYFQTGEGDVTGLVQKYQKHPGWIPAFANAVYDKEEDVLYVPLGQCVWKIFSDYRGDMRFGLLRPNDKGLDSADKMMLLRRLFQLTTEAERNKDYERSRQAVQLAGRLLYPNAKSSSATSSLRSTTASPRRCSFDDNL